MLLRLTKEVCGDWAQLRCFSGDEAWRASTTPCIAVMSKRKHKALAVTTARIGGVGFQTGAGLESEQEDAFSWTALICEHNRCGRSREALRVYEEMQGKGVKPTSYTFVAALKACSRSGELEAGKEIHAHVIESGCESQVFVGTMLVDMYAKCGSMVDARRVFEKMPCRDVVSWNAMILGYVQMEEADVAWQLYSRMQREGVVGPDDRTFVAALKACGSMAAMEGRKKGDVRNLRDWCLQQGRAIHAQVVQRGFETDIFVANTLVDMYGKCGSMMDALGVFDQMSHRNVVSWSAIILAYSQMEEGEEALQLYARMQMEGVVPNDRTFVGALKACGSLAAFEEGEEFHGKLVKKGCLERGRAIDSQMRKSGFESDVFVGNTLVDMYAKCGSMMDARHAFERMPRRSIVSWSAMILGYAQMEEGEVALQLYSRMQQEGFAPNDRAFVGALKACSSLAASEECRAGGKLKKRWLEQGRAIHSQVVKGGYEADVFVATMLMDMYGKCGSMLDAGLVFEKIPHPSAVCFNALIAGYAEGQSEEVFHLFSEMQKQGLSANSVTYVSVLKACGNAADLDTGTEIHAQIRAAGLDDSEIVANTLIDMYSKCGSMGDAQQAFDAASTRSVVTWGALIAGYARQGQSELVCGLFQRMRHEGIQPNGIIFLNVLTACSHAGLVDMGLEYFHDMSKGCGLTPNIQHYSCLVDLLGRAGQLEDAMDMAEKMPFQPDPVMWRTLLGACRKWNDVEVGRNVFERSRRLDQTDAAAYVLMSNIFADGHMWEEVKNVQATRLGSKAWKEPGQSWTGMGGIMHRFVVGDEEHPGSPGIYAKLKDLHVMMDDGQRLHTLANPGMERVAMVE